MYVFGVPPPVSRNWIVLNAPVSWHVVHRVTQIVPSVMPSESKSYNDISS